MNERNKSVADRILCLVQEALAEFDKPDYRLSNIMRRAIRIARLRNDYENLLWLENEMVTFSPEEKSAHRFIKEIVPHFSRSELERIRREIVRQYMWERRMMEVDNSGVRDSGKIDPRGVPELEKLIQVLEDGARGIKTPQGLTPIDLYFKDISNSNYREKLQLEATFTKQLLERIAHRVHDFLSVTEKQLVYGQANAEVFEKYRQYVDGKLNQIAPEALNQFVSAYRRSREGDTEARSQALLSCRRILKTLADHIYPPSDKPIVGADGKEHDISEEQYINRLWQYVADRVTGHATGELLLAQIKDLGNRIDRLYELTCKGTHANVSEYETNQCIIQTYLTLGDILHLADGDSVILSQVSDTPQSS